MTGRNHTYRTTVVWTGDLGTGTSGYRDYTRDHELSVDAGTGSAAGVGGDGVGGTAVAGPATILGSSDPAFRGDRARWNPEQLLTGSLSQCHMLWYLHLCSAAGVVVTSYVDDAAGVMSETSDGSGHFAEVVLRPRVTVAAQAMVEQAVGLHADAHRMCFIANSVNFPVRHEPTVLVAAESAG